MNRRYFLASMLTSAIAPSFLAGAGRSWKRTQTRLMWVPNPDWDTAPIEMEFFATIGDEIVSVKHVNRYIRDQNGHLIRVSPGIWA